MIHLIKFLLKVLCTPIAEVPVVVGALLSLVFWKKSFIVKGTEMFTDLWDLD
jgi:ABC-type molybdate transport system permease subunit